ncbi:DUF1566 domain-containing protein [Leptospira licerasiae]|uniref:Lcl C-terminal domain-containing protein n=1 Tax=Leptospira licerasiae str. MMD4847 TaxID=1049971 RepID=A0ABP2RHU2_9LEPT|nr:DUF1566 domain-containing protein [Leptospira licerasiae]EIE00342.1 hypothetical protein LEP1GSC185_3258 [Leptospira licerasiae serovar Varillal str. VAR 010]EJZ42969.1 hypothetical protein LEP1GSC178_2875 [Leptospira licerasiae str. MMD4847]
MKRLTLLFLFSYLSLANCGSDSKQDLSGLLLLLAGGGGLNSFHCGQTVANPVTFANANDAYINSVNNDSFITALGGNNCGTATLVDNDNGTVTDSKNHFLWTLCTGFNSGTGTISLYDYVTGDCNAGSVTANDFNITQAEAETFCDNLTLAGHSDWMLPDAIQLYSLYSSTNPFALSSFGTKSSLARVGGAWSTTQRNSQSIVNVYGSATDRFFSTNATSTAISSFICVAKL